MTDLAQRVRIWLVMAATAVLLLNSLAASLASGAAAEMAVDAFGNPLCITSVSDDGAVPAGDHSKHPDCCTFACNMGSSAVIAISDADDATPIVWPPRRAFAQPGDSPTPLRSSDYDPGNPRAPPLTA